MSTRLIAVAVFLVAFASLAHAELSPTYADWADGPERFLLTKDELKEWKTITTDAQAKRFIELFWARRNPKPDEPFNAFKADFEGRVRYADEEFGYEGMRGALTDRARVIILLGVPHQAERRAPTETVQVIGSQNTSSGMGTDEVRSNVLMWVYDPARLPKEIKVRGTRVMFVFYEEKTGSNNFTLDRSHQEAPMAFRTLSRAPEAFLLYPELTEIPKPVSVPGGTPASTDHLAMLDGGVAPFNEQAMVLADVGVADPVNLPLWLHVELPDDAPELDILAGRVSTADGEVTSTFQIAAVALQAGANRAYHLSFPMRPGACRVEVVGVAGGQAQMVVATDQEIVAPPLDQEWMTPVWAGVTVNREEEAPLGTAFTLGGWHVIPIAGAPVAKQSELSLFGFVVRPGLADDGTLPQTRAKIVLKRDGKRLGSPLRMDIGSAKVMDGLYLYATTLNLAAFPEGGEYLLEVTIEDPVVAVKTKREFTINLVE